MESCISVLSIISLLSESFCFSSFVDRTANSNALSVALKSPFPFSIRRSRASFVNSTLYLPNPISESLRARSIACEISIFLRRCNSKIWHLDRIAGEIEI